MVAWVRTLGLTMVLASTPVAVGMAAEELGGRPFSPPGEVVEMPAEWTAKGISRPPGVDVALALDQQIYPALLPLVHDYAAKHGIKVALQEGTCGIASGALGDKSADITGMCCPPGPLDRLPGVHYHTIGIASIALIVNPANRVADLTLAQARSLFGGSTGRWSDLPVSGIRASGDDTVRAVARLHCRPRPGHWRLLLDSADQFAADVTEVPAIRDMIAEVARQPTAIGYETLWHVAQNAQLGQVKVVRLGGVDPHDGSALAQGRYPLYRVFNITTWEGPNANPAAAGLAAFLTAHAAELDPSYGIVPASELRRYGWRFAGDEVVDEPRR